MIPTPEQEKKILSDHSPECPMCNSKYPELIDVTLDEFNHPILSRWNCACGYGFDVKLRLIGKHLGA